MLSYVVRAVRWQPVVIAMLPCAAVLGWIRWAPVGLGRPSPIGVFGAAAVVAAIGLAFCLDDPAAATLDATPVGASRRRRWHLAVGVAAVLGCWGVVLALAPASTPLGWASAAAAGLCSAALAAGAVGARALGPVAAGAVGGIGAVLARLGAGAVHTWALGPTDALATVHWLVAAGVFTGVLAAASRDPAARWRWR